MPQAFWTHPRSAGWIATTGSRTSGRAVTTEKVAGRSRVSAEWHCCPIDMSDWAGPVLTAYFWGAVTNA